MKVLFTPSGWADYQHWLATDLKLVAKINVLIDDARRSPFKGLGKPEPLKESWAGWWSRRISDEDRLIYRVVGKGDAQHIEIAQCRLHY